MLSRWYSSIVDCSERMHGSAYASSGNARNGKGRGSENNVWFSHSRHISKDRLRRGIIPGIKRMGGVVLGNTPNKQD